MAKNVTVFFCKECGYESGKWLGQCPGCKSWNSFEEASAIKKGNDIKRNIATKGEVVKLSDIKTSKEIRLKTNIGELDRVLGGGIVKGSLTLVGGDPGIGKSTLLLQLCKNLGDKGVRLLYISGEESWEQIKLRAKRIGDFSDNVYLYCETNLDFIEETIKENKPEVVIIDSIQTMYKPEITSTPGSVSQVKESTNIFMQIAKKLNISIFVVGHVTKEGVVAGPKVLEHMVDTVLYFEGDRYASYRILRGVKNRFGATNEIGVFEMKYDGLREVENPSEYMLGGRILETSGSVISASLEGTRPILIEVQALVSATNFGIPRRVATGTDYNRVNLLLAVIEKRAGIQINNNDVYVNIAGGIKINEPALDLAIVLSVISSFKNKAVSSDTLVFGEIGLAGEVRSVSQVKDRILEGIKLGFKKCILPKQSLNSIDKREIEGMDIELIGVSDVSAAVELIR